MNDSEGSASIFVGLITLLKVVGVILHIWTVIVAYQINSLISAIVSLCCPILAEIYFVFRMGDHTGTILNPYSISVMAFAFCYAFAFFSVMATSDR